MKAEINERGILIITAENKLESYAMDQWEINNRDGCSTKFKAENTYEILQLYPYEPKKITLFHRIWLRFQLWLYR